MTAALPCEQILREAVEMVGCTLWSATYTPGKKRHITVLIDKDGGASLADCEKVMDQIQWSDASPIKDYAFDVASPGLDRYVRSIEHYQHSLFKYVEIKSTELLADTTKKSLRGYLTACDADCIQIECNEGVYTIPYNAISQCRWVFTTIPYNKEEKL